MGGADTTEEQRTVPSAALLTFFDNDLKYYPPADQACPTAFLASSDVGGTNIPGYSSADSSLGLMEQFADSGCELSSVEEPTTTEYFAPSPDASSFSAALDSPSAVACSAYSDDELSASMSPLALGFNERGGAENEPWNQVNDVMPDSFEEFFYQASKNDSFYHHGHPHSL